LDPDIRDSYTIDDLVGEIMSDTDAREAVMFVMGSFDNQKRDLLGGKMYGRRS
jgi:hypothetical protein